MTVGARRGRGSEAARRGVAAAGRRLVRTLDLRQPSWVRPLPRVEVELAPWVPAWLVHLFAGAVAVSCVATVANSRPQWVLASLLIGLLLVRPSGGPAALFVLWIGLQVATSDPASYGLDAFGLVFGIHLLAVLFTISADLHLRTRLELRVFVDPFRRFLVIQLVTQPLAWATMSLARGEVTLPWLRIVAAMGLAVLSWMVVGQFVARRTEP